MELKDIVLAAIGDIQKEEEIQKLKEIEQNVKNFFCKKNTKKRWKTFAHFCTASRKRTNSKFFKWREVFKKTKRKNLSFVWRF